MTTLIKTFACAAAASLLLLSCNDTAPTASSEEDNNPTVAKGQPPNDPAVVIIEDNVQKWMNENLASKIGEKRLVQVSDMHLDDSEAPGLSASYNSAGEAEYYQNGQKISSQEYMRIWQEYDMKKQRGKRNLSIPGEIISDDSRSWTVLITAEELAGLTKKYGELAISFYTEPTNDVDVPVSGGNGTQPMIPVVPPSILGCPLEDLEKEGKYPLPKNDPLPPNDRDGLPPPVGVCDASVLKLSAEELSFDAQGGVRCVTSSGYITLGGGGNGCREERMLVSDTINNPPQFINVNSFKRLVCPWFTATDVGLSKEGRRTLHISVNQNETGKKRETSVYYSLGNCDSGLKITQAK